MPEPTKNQNTNGELFLRRIDSENDRDRIIFFARSNGQGNKDADNKFQPIKGPAETWEAERLDVTRASLEAFAQAARGGAAYPITTEEMIHGVAVTEAIVRSASSNKVEKV